MSPSGTRVGSIDWDLSKQVLIFWLGVFLLAVAIDRNRWALTWPGFIESWSWLVLLSLFVLRPEVRTFLRALERPYLILVSGVIGTLLFGQFIGAEPERTYPIVMWRMFSGDIRPLQPFSYFSYVGESSGDAPLAGKSIELGPVKLFPPLRNQLLTISMNWLIEAALAEKPEGGGGDKSPSKRRELDLALAAIGRAHNREHPAEQRIARVGIDRCDFSPEKRAVVGRQRIWTVDVAPGEGPRE